MYSFIVYVVLGLCATSFVCSSPATEIDLSLPKNGSASGSREKLARRERANEALELVVGSVG